MRMEVTADYAAGHDFQVIATTNATSRWKDADQVQPNGVWWAGTPQKNSAYIHDKGKPVND
jgi:predicted adenine nucleotide alpha hydrolase (AANH) superfamily ATPase